MKVGTEMELKTTSLDDFFNDTFSQKFLDEAEIEYALARIAARASAAKDEADLSVRELAKRMGSGSPAVVQRILDEAKPHNVTVATLVRFAHACGFELRVEFAPKSHLVDWFEQKVASPEQTKWRSPTTDREHQAPQRDRTEGRYQPALALAA